MKKQPFLTGSIFAVGIIVIAVCVGMVNGFGLTDPFISVDPVSDKNMGDTFVITGTTDLPAGTELIFEVYPSSFNPQTNSPPPGKMTAEFFGATGTMIVGSGDGATNTWAFDLDTAPFPPQEYFVNVSAFSGDLKTGTISLDVAYGTALFQLKPAPGETDDAFSQNSGSARYIRIDPVAETTTGDLLILSGSTNFPEGTILMIHAAGWGSDAKVRKGTGGVNVWSTPLDTSISKPGISNITVTNMVGDPASGDYRTGNISGTASLTLNGTFLAMETPVQPTITRDDFLLINAIGNRSIGDQFLITGTTSLPVGTEVLWEVTPTSLTADPNQTGEFSGAMANSQVTKGEGKINRVKYALDTYALLPGQYNVTVSVSAGDLTKGDFRPGKLTGSALFTLSAPQQPAQSASVESKGTITFDRIGDKKAGDTFTITGSTNLPEGTDLFWQIMPDKGTPPTGVDMNAQTGIMANNYVTNSSGLSNRVSLDVDMRDMKPGRYVVMTASLGVNPATIDPATGTLAGYTYFILK